VRWGHAPGHLREAFDEWVEAGADAKTVTVGISRSDETLLLVPLVKEVLAAGAPRDSLTYPTKGWLTDLAVEYSIPPSDLMYYRLTAQQQYLATFRNTATPEELSRCGMVLTLRTATV
jgi:hypothetical protein